MKRTAQQAALHSPQHVGGEPATNKSPPALHHPHPSLSLQQCASSSKRAKYSHKLELSTLRDTDATPAWLHDACLVFVESTPPLVRLNYDNQRGSFKWATWLDQLYSRQFWTRATSTVLEACCKSKSDSKTSGSSLPAWLGLVDACRTSGQCCSAAALHSIKPHIIFLIISLVVRRAEANCLTNGLCKLAPPRHRRHEPLLTLVRLLNTAFIYSAYNM